MLCVIRELWAVMCPHVTLSTTIRLIDSLPTKQATKALGFLSATGVDPESDTAIPCRTKPSHVPLGLPV